MTGSKETWNSGTDLRQRRIRALHRARRLVFRASEYSPQISDYEVQLPTGTRIHSALHEYLISVLLLITFK